MTEPRDPPKQELLIKLLKMTTSTNDSEALVALRKANELLVTAKWDWERLIRGKITVIADPFDNLGKPPQNQTFGTPSSPQPPPMTPYTPKPPPPPKPAPPPPLCGTPNSPISTMPNRFSGFCYCCGIEAVTNAGFIFKKTPAQSNYNVVCASCNTSAIVPPYPATPQRQKRKKSVSDLA